jgi:thioredoxin-dependent peroxiredoxin
MSARPREGDPAPDFTLDGPEGPFTLSAQRGRPVVLLFYPGDETPVCTRQFCSYRDRSTDLEALGALVVGISGGSVDAKRRFTERHGLSVPLLADEGGSVSRAYGVRGPLGPRRATFVIDEQGVVRAARVHALGLRYEDVDDIAGMLGAARA